MEHSIPSSTLVLACTFTGWRSDLTSTVSPAIVTVTGDMTVITGFDPTRFYIWLPAVLRDK